MLIPYNVIVNFIIKRCCVLKIDESHALGHSLEVLKYSQRILDWEKKENKNYKYNERIIFTSALIHDMCDNKYMDEKKGIDELQEFLVTNSYEKYEIKGICDIIGTMSYSKVKKNGFPILDNFEKEYHIVREADLLTGYNLERCIVFGIYGRDFNYVDSFIATKELYERRMASQIKDNLFTTKYGLEEAEKLDKENKLRIKELSELLE